MLNNRKTIGILIFDITAYYQTQLIRHLSRYTEEKGYNLLVFSGFSIYGRDTKNAKGEYNIMNLIPFEELDAFILCQDTYENKDTVIKVQEMIQKRFSGPVISIRSAAEDCYNILADDEDAIPSMIRHMYEEHSYERIAFMSGPFSHPDAAFRLKKYKETMEQLGLSCPDEYIYEGDFWKMKGDDAASYFSHLDPPPQAIVCANDYMALALCKGLILQGYQVPKDFAICGFDDIVGAAANIPPLTTCRVSIEDLAYLAVDTIYELLQGHEVAKKRYTKVETVIRNSCGCDTVTMHDISKNRMQQLELTEALENQTIHNTFISIALENLVVTEDIGDYLLIEDYPDCTRDFYLCLGKNGRGGFPQMRLGRPGFAKRSQSIYSLKDLAPIVTSSFVTKDLLPPEGIREEPMCIFFFPIHYLQYGYGYVAACSNGKENTNHLFHSWLAIVGNTLEHARVRNKNESLLDKLNALYVQDSLTKLYNRRGFEQFSTSELEQSYQVHVTSMVLGIDMDNLKYINDVFGHAHGDIALCTIARAMQSACQGDEICARLGGDEFEVFGFHYNRDMAEEYVTKFQNYLDKFNATSNLPYRVNASTGYTLTQPDTRQNLEYYIKESDKLLYKNKRERKQQFGNLSQRTADTSINIE